MIERYARLFFNFSLLPYARQFGKQKYDETFTILNLSDFGQKVYNRFYKNSIKHPKKITTEQEKLIVKKVEEIREIEKSKEKIKTVKKEMIEKDEIVALTAVDRLNFKSAHREKPVT